MLNTGPRSTYKFLAYFRISDHCSPLASAGLVGAALFLSTERRRLMSAKALALLGGDDANEDGGESKRLHELRSRISNAAIV